MGNINITEESLRRALESLGLTQMGLPKMWRGEQDGFWIKALALVRKQNGDQSYCAVERDADGRIGYRMDFGRMSPILERVRLYPYVYLDEGRYVNIGSADDRRFLLLSEANDAEERNKIRSMSDDEVIYYLRKRGIERQLSGVDDAAIQRDDDIAVREEEASLSSVIDDDYSSIVEAQMLKRDLALKEAVDAKNICSDGTDGQDSVVAKVKKKRAVRKKK